MCLIARHLEQNGIPTVCLASALDIVESGRPPRAVFLDYPLGHTAGRPFDRADQRSVVGAALSALETITSPGEIVRLGNRWSGSDAWRSSASDTAADDVRAPRDTQRRYQTESDRIATQASGAERS